MSVFLCYVLFFNTNLLQKIKTSESQWMMCFTQMITFYVTIKSKFHNCLAEFVISRKHKLLLILLFDLSIIVSQCNFTPSFPVISSELKKLLIHSACIHSFHILLLQLLITSRKISSLPSKQGNIFIFKTPENLNNFS